VESDQGYARAWHGLGVLEAEDRKWGMAASMFKRAVAARHDYAAAHADLARVLREAGKHDEAAKAAAEAKRIAGAKPIAGVADASLDVLDLGCGTGLCGALLRRWARTLVGVDLSPGMLEKARERGCYDRLEQGDLVAVMRTMPARSFDLIVATDVLIYIGDF